jgi:hypothetical protein
MARVCPHCKALATFTRRWSNSSASRDGDIDPDKPLLFCDTCDNCESPVCGACAAGSTLDEEPCVWPEVTPYVIQYKAYPDVPEAISIAASEAHQALGADAPHASIAMARAVIEATAKDKGVTVNGIYNKIEQLAVRGYITPTLKEAAHEIRFAGNEVAHGDLVATPIGVAEAAEVVDLMDVILERVYQEPAKVALVRASREARRSGQQPTSGEG